MYAVVLLGRTEVVPLVALLGRKDPEHEVALFEDQVRVLLWPLIMVVGLAERLALTGEGLLTVTLVVAATPLQTTV